MQVSGLLLWAAQFIEGIKLEGWLCHKGRVLWSERGYSRLNSSSCNISCSMQKYERCHKKIHVKKKCQHKKTFQTNGWKRAHHSNLILIFHSSWQTTWEVYWKNVKRRLVQGILAWMLRISLNWSRVIGFEEFQSI